MIFGHVAKIIYMSIWIKNANNTSNQRPPFLFNPWLEYWESKKRPIKVSELSMKHCLAHLIKTMRVSRSVSV